MGRHSDWSVVGLSADPTPGNVWGVRTVATGYQTIATAADTAHTVLSRVKSTGTSTVWAGDAAEVFRDNLGDFPDHVKKCADSFALAATAVSSWASTMDLAQDKADRGLAKAELAQADLEAAQAALASAESLAADAASSLEDKQDLYDLYKNSTPPAGVTVPTSYQLTQLRTQRNGANSGVSSASGDVADAQARLDAAKALVLEALEDYEAGATTLKGSIDDAKDAGVEADSFWEAVFNSEAWAVLIVVLTVVAIVLAVAAFFVTGPLALILAVASVVVGAVMMANDIMAFLNGDMSPLEFAIAIALSVIPGGALAKAAAKALKPLAKAGESIAQGVRTTTKLDNAERPRTVFRNDNRGPNDIFADGFQPHPGHDPSVSLQDYVLSNRPSSFVGASKDPTFYTRWGGSHRYEIQDPGNGVDVNQVLGRTHPYANEFEVAYPGGIPASSIIGARPIKGDGTLGDFITNPGFVSQ